MTITQWPQGLNRKQSEDYVGGRLALQDLQRAFPDTVAPWRQTGKSQLYRRDDLDAAMAKARLLKEPLGKPNES